VTRSSSLARALAVVVAIVGLVACGGGGKAAKKIAKPVLPPADPAAVREFDAALRVHSLGGPEADDRARARLERAVAIDRRLWEAWHDLGALRFAAGDDDGALEAFDAALAINPASTPTLLARAEARRRTGQQAGAEADYRQALAQDPQAPRPYARTASLLREQGNHEGALAVLREALRLIGATSEIYLELGMVYLGQGRGELAELVLNRAAGLDAKNPAVYNAMALVLLARGRDQEAFERFYQAAALDPSFHDARFNVASVLIDSGDYGRAKEELDKVVAAAPDDLAAKVALGVAQRGVGQLDAARATWESVVAQAGRSSVVRGDALYDLAVLAADFVRDDAKAIAAYDRYLREAPGNHPRRKAAEERRKELGQ
jgi:tetratricopeptide (TPR) repeat protein